MNRLRRLAILLLAILTTSIGLWVLLGESVAAFGPRHEIRSRVTPTTELNTIRVDVGVSSSNSAPARQPQGPAVELRRNHETLASTTSRRFVATEAAPQYVYREGSRSADNLTPRPGVDDTGLSTFDTPAAAAPNGGKVQVIDTTKLKCTVACPDAPPRGHVSIRPPDAAEIPGWAGMRGTGQISSYTQDIMDAIVDEIRLLRS